MLWKDGQPYSQEHIELDLPPQRLTEPTVDRKLVFQRK
jgi:hypothetical protein